MAICCWLTVSLGCRQSSAWQEGGPTTSPGNPQRVTPVDNPVLRQMIEAAIDQVNYTKVYDPAYVKLAYPMGDVPVETGVCSDVIVRAFRKVGIDLQKEVHEDMKRNFGLYPQKWGLKRPDTNIDHRRVPNLMTFFKRRGKAVPVTANATDYKPGDIVAWDLGDGVTHIGVMTNIAAGGGERYTVIHNIGAGARVEDVLLSWKIIGHYRYF